jgi:hypothetical protein
MRVADLKDDVARLQEENIEESNDRRAAVVREQQRLAELVDAREQLVKQETELAQLRRAKEALEDEAKKWKTEASRAAEECAKKDKLLEHSEQLNDNEIVVIFRPVLRQIAIHHNVHSNDPFIKDILVAFRKRFEMTEN